MEVILNRLGYEDQEWSTIRETDSPEAMASQRQAGVTEQRAESFEETAVCVCLCVCVSVCLCVCVCARVRVHG